MPGPGVGPNQPQDALTAARFSVVIDGYEVASFQELSGLETEVAPADYITSSDKEVTYKKLPGLQKPPTVTLKRGMTGGMELFSWHQTVREGKMTLARKSCSIVMYNSDGTPVARFYLENAWPSKLTLGALKAGASEILSETVTIVCESLQRVSP